MRQPGCHVSRYHPTLATNDTHKEKDCILQMFDSISKNHNFLYYLIVLTKTISRFTIKCNFIHLYSFVSKFYIYYLIKSSFAQRKHLDCKILCKYKCRLPYFESQILFQLPVFEREVASKYSGKFHFFMTKFNFSDFSPI